MVGPCNVSQLDKFRRYIRSAFGPQHTRPPSPLVCGSTVPLVATRQLAWPPPPMPGPFTPGGGCVPAGGGRCVGGWSWQRLSQVNRWNRKRTACMNGVGAVPHARGIGWSSKRMRSVHVVVPWTALRSSNPRRLRESGVVGIDGSVGRIR